jgi:hypothetical protein
MSCNEIILPNIKFRNTLKKHNISFSVIDQITEKIKKIPQYESIRIELELVKCVCNIIENCIKKGNNKKIDKKDLVINCLSSVYNYNDQEKLLVGSLIDFLFNNKQIKKSSTYKLVKNYLLSYTKAK